MRKGYEEIHVPAVQSVVFGDEKLVSIKELPIWTQAAFKGMEQLNRILKKKRNEFLLGMLSDEEFFRVYQIQCLVSDNI